MVHDGGPGGGSDAAFDDTAFDDTAFDDVAFDDTAFDTVRQHLQEEETELFPRLSSACPLEVLHELGGRLRAARPPGEGAGD